jgi:hypothetical protein
VTAVDDELVEVRLLGFPLQAYERAQEHGDGLVRELMLIAQSSPQEHEVPVRLTAIVTELSSRFAGFGDDTDAVRDAAIDRGERSIDLVYRLPRAAGAASVHLGDILDEADEYCRQGEHLLSLTTPPEALAFRRWFLGEIVRQVDGEAPTSWPAYLATHPIG